MPPPGHRHNMLCLWPGGGIRRKKGCSRTEAKGQSVSEISKANMKTPKFKLILGAPHQKPCVQWKSIPILNCRDLRNWGVINQFRYGLRNNSLRWIMVVNFPEKDKSSFKKRIHYFARFAKRLWNLFQLTVPITWVLLFDDQVFLTWWYNWF